jgi:hypothetical protein
MFVEKGTNPLCDMAGGYEVFDSERLAFIMYPGVTGNWTQFPYSPWMTALLVSRVFFAFAGKNYF